MVTVVDEGLVSVLQHRHSGGARTGAFPSVTSPKAGKGP